VAVTAPVDWIAWVITDGIARKSDIGTSMLCEAICPAARGLQADEAFTQDDRALSAATSASDPKLKFT
jgi:hypothetical protein